MENIGGGIAAPLKSAVGPIWHSRWLEIEIAQKTWASMSFSLFSLNINIWWSQYQSISFENPSILMYKLSS